MARTAEQKWQEIAKKQLGLRGVTGGTRFGRSEGLRISSKIFAMLVKGELVVKLPRSRVDELVATGIGEHYDPGHGRLMQEWITVESSASRRWSALVAEARDFVASTAKPPKKSAPKR